MYAANSPVAVAFTNCLRWACHVFLRDAEGSPTPRDCKWPAAASQPGCIGSGNKIIGLGDLRREKGNSRDVRGGPELA